MSEPTQTPPWEKYDARYRAFREREDIPVHEGLYIEDIRTVAVDDWERTGGHGAFVDLFGMEGMCDIHLGEILPGERLRPQRHLHEKLVFVVQGNGIISLRTDERSRTFEWGPGALFYLPRNTEYVHTNSDPERSVRLLAVTPLSLLYTLLQDDEAIWEIERYDQWATISDSTFYERSAQLLEGTTDPRTYWDANFIPDATTFDQLASCPNDTYGHKYVKRFGGSMLSSAESAASRSSSSVSNRRLPSA